MRIQRHYRRHGCAHGHKSWLKVSPPPYLEFSAPRCLRLASFVLICLLCQSASLAPAQETPRLSLAGPEAARARRLADSALPDPDLRLGPSVWSFAAQLACQATDNLQASPDSPEPDVSFRPALITCMHLPLSELNTLKFSAETGGILYLRHPELDRPFIAPGSELALNVYLPNCWLQVHDRFAIVDNPYADPTVTSLADYARLQNSAGFDATWDLNRLCARLGYDHLFYSALGSSSSVADGQSDSFSASASYSAWPGLHAGLQLDAALLRYSAAPAPSADAGELTATTDGTQAGAGAFLNGSLSSHMDFYVGAGYTTFRPDTAAAFGAAREFSGVYAQAVLDHRLNQILQYAVSGGHLLNFGFFGGLLEQSFARLDCQWLFLRQIALSTSFQFQHGTQLGFNQETFDWFGPAITASRRLTAKLTSTLGYQFYWRTSDLPNRDYSANVLTATLNYQF